MNKQVTLALASILAIVSLTVLAFQFKSGIITQQQGQEAAVTTSVTSSTLSLGDRIQTATSVSVRSSAGSGRSLGTQPQGAIGTLVGGPTVIKSTTWWKVDFDTGVDGWVSESTSYLVKYLVKESPSAIPVSSCQTISSAGTYTLTGNISTGANCFNITADNVILDGAGYTVSGGNAGVGIYIQGVRQGVVVKNITVQNFGIGIVLVNSRYARVENSTVRNSVQDGISLQATNYPPVSSEISSYNTITTTTVDNSSNHGILIGYGSQYNTISSNTIRNTVKYSGIKSEGWGTNTILGNTVTNTTSGTRGIESSNTAGDIIQSNNVSSTTVGIVINNSQKMLVTQNVSCGNTMDIACTEAYGTASQNSFVSKNCSFVGTPVSCPLPADTTKPIATLTNPTNGSTISGTIQLQANASDNVGVTRVDFAVDSVFFGSDTTAPYSIPYDTNQIPNGSHTFTATAYDAAGNSSLPGTAPSANVQNTVSSTWIKQAGGTGYEYSKATAVDSSGNVIVAGFFFGSTNFGGTTFTSTSGSYDMFLAKYNPSGNLIWVKQYGAAGTEGVKSITVDSSGNIFVAGSIYGTANLGGSNLVSAGDADAFLAKYSSSGDHIWSISFGDTLTDVVKSVTTDSQGNAIITGSYSGLVPLISEYRTSFVTVTFLLKFSPTGSVVWAKSFNMSGNVGVAVDVDSSNNIALAGYFQGGIDLGGGNLLSSQTGGYVGKFSSSGSHIWSRNAGISAFPYKTLPESMTVDSNGDVVVGGYFVNSTDLGGGNISGTSSGWDMFLSKYSSSNGAYQWARAITGNHTADIASISTDSQRNILIAGSFLATYNFGNQSLTSPTYNVPNGFLAKYGPGSTGTVGAPIWAKGLIGSGTQNLTGVAVDSTNHPIVTGDFSGAATFAGQAVPTNAGGADVFLGRLDL
jgi:parallel beta-helix repeat protein